MNQFQFFVDHPAILGIFLLWSLVWKGLALWKAATKKQLLWFILILIINSLGILEIIYIFILNRWDIDKGRTLKFLQTQLKKKS
jgi:methionyl-tRNA synthetase